MNNQLRFTIILLLLALLAVGLNLAVNEAAEGSPAVGRGQSDCQKYPVLATAKGAVKRANKGWDSEKLKKSQPAIKRVRIQKRCAPTRKGRKHVRRAIDNAKSDYKKALRNVSPWPPAEELPDYNYLYGVAECETGGKMDPAIHDDATGSSYHGLFQFDLQTWGSVGGGEGESASDPHAASWDEQFYYAQRLYDSRGSSPWPICG